MSRLARDPPAGREAGRRGSALLHLPAGASAVLFYTCHTVDRLNLSGNSYFALESKQLIDRHSNLTDTVTNHLELISIVGGEKMEDVIHLTVHLHGCASYFDIEVLFWSW